MLRLSGQGPQEAGRSSGLPVHCPDWPAPLPPFVGGGASAEAAEARPRLRTAARAAAAARRDFMAGSSLLGYGGTAFRPTPQAPVRRARPMAASEE